MTETKQLTEQQKVRKLYDVLGERGLYVNTNFDVFSQKPEEISLAQGAGYKLSLANPDSQAYASPLLFATLTSLLHHGTMLITGAPGIGKTTGAEFAGHFFTGTRLEDILASEILGYPQLTEEKLIASYDLGKLINQGERVVVPNNFLKCPVKIIDEGNRIPPDTLSILMRLADTGKAVYGGQLLTAATGPLFVTANYADEGTFHFTPPFLDRFDVAVMVTSPQPWDLRRIRERGDEKLNGNLENLLVIPEGTKIDFDKARKAIKDMPESAEYGVSKVAEFSDFMYAALRFSEAASTDLVRATKGNAWKVNQDNAKPGHFNDGPHNYTLNELSVRTMKALQRYAKAFAWFNGDKTTNVTHLKTVLPYLLWHKVQPAEKALAEEPYYHNDRITFINGLVEKVETDYEEFVSDGEHRQAYKGAIGVLQHNGRVGERKLEEDQIRAVVRNAILKIGNVDKPWAVSLANHIASEYNARNNRRKYEAD